LKIHLNIIPSSIPGSPKLSLSLRFPTQKPCIRLSSPHTRYMPRLSHFSRNVIEVIIQDWRHMISCQCYCTQHTSSLSQSQAHCTDVTVDEQTNSKSQHAITALASFSDYVSTIKCA
jgi:hypothetical protein